MEIHELESCLVFIPLSTKRNKTLDQYSIEQWQLIIFTMMKNPNVGVAWLDCAARVIIYAANYLDFDGNPCVGGRQRFIRDIALLIKEWGREVVVVQKANSSFEKLCPVGITVIGIKANISAKGDVLFARRAARFAQPGDVFLYASGEDAWPFFADNSKSIQHGIWWDGPQNLRIRVVQRIRALGMMRSVRSVLCVDTNFINWLRCLGSEGYALANKCEYVPNYADLSKVSVSERDVNDRLAIISARRYELKRGADLLMDALGILKSTGLDFEAHFSTAGGVDELTRRARQIGLDEQVSVSEDSMDEVLSRYRDFHVAVVPTLWSEGTSLACVEAIAAGLAVVCTPVGGLGNLVFPGFNGNVVPPTAERIAEALYQCSDKVALASMRAGSLSMRDSLGMDQWKKTVLSWLTR